MKKTGDGFLAEFPSAVETVRAAMQFQARIRELTSGDAEGSRILFRVGLNIGDIIVEAKDIFGDGVNIAARLESIAKPGGYLPDGLQSRARQGELRGRGGGRATSEEYRATGACL